MSILLNLAAYTAALAVPFLSDYSAPVPSESNLQSWTKHIRPSADEVRHEELPWITTFGEGLIAASEQTKPLLFWGMNGHPLGCT